MRYLFFVLSALAATVSAALAQTARPDYSGAGQSVFIRYLDDRGGLMDRSPAIGLSFGGRVVRATLDSGSTGIVVAASSIPDLAQLPVLGDGRLTYTSSGRIMLGRWVTTAVTISGAGDERITTEPMPVLAVTEVQCLENARDCEPSTDPVRIAMVGIGFGREQDAQSQGTPDRNPFLRVADDGDYPGYVLTATGVHVGLDSEVSQGEFIFVKLARNPAGDDWSGVPACIAVGGALPAACGSMLLDTGVGSMFLTVPSAQAGGESEGLAEGTEIAISVGTAASQTPLYHFATGDGSELAPDGVHLRVAPDRVFVNTSYHLLNGFDFLYDAKAGYAGFRKK
jgi:hypothetical protein